jgi:formiminoglutamase
MIEAEELELKGPEAYLPVIDAILERVDVLMVGICMDVFSSAFAPGVSAPQPAGLFPIQVTPLLRRLAASPKVVGLHVAELSPPFDYDGRTAQLAAYMISNYIRAKVNI